MAFPGHTDLLFYGRSMFYGVVIGVLPSLAINLLRKKTLVVLFKVFGSCLSFVSLYHNDLGWSAV